MRVSGTAAGHGRRLRARARTRGLRPARDATQSVHTRARVRLRAWLGRRPRRDIRTRRGLAAERGALCRSPSNSNASQAVSHRPLAHVVDLVASHDRRPARRSDEVHSATRGRVDATIARCATSRSRSPRARASGIIGRNGAGKTTLLKLISRVTLADQRQGARRRPRGLAHRARRRLSSRADRPRERVSRRRAVRPDAPRDRQAVRRHRAVRRRRAADRHADEALLVRASTRASASASPSTATPTSCWSTKCCRSATRRSAAARSRRCAS